MLVQPVGDVNGLVTGSDVENNLGKNIKSVAESLYQDGVVFVDHLLTVSVSLRSTFTVVFLLLGELLLAACLSSSYFWAWGLHHRTH